MEALLALAALYLLAIPPCAFGLMVVGWFAGDAPRKTRPRPTLRERIPLVEPERRRRAPSRQVADEDDDLGLLEEP